MKHRKQCMEIDCTNPVYARERCTYHYNQHRRSDACEWKSPCIEAGCTKAAEHKDGRCTNCYRIEKRRLIRLGLWKAIGHEGIHDARPRRYAYIEVRNRLDTSSVKARIAERQSCGTNAHGEREFFCAYCGDRHVLGNLHVEHCIPWSFARINDDWNLTLACGRCNNIKGTRTPRAAMRDVIAGRPASAESEDDLMHRFLSFAPGHCSTLDWPAGSESWTPEQWRLFVIGKSLPKAA